MQHLDLSFPLSSRDFKIQQQRERKSYSKSIKREALEDRGEARDARLSGRERERKFGKERERERERERRRRRLEREGWLLQCQDVRRSER